MQGASALGKLLRKNGDPKIRVFVIWEPVLPTDFGAPSTFTLKRVSDPRASQYWDKEHLVSTAIGARDPKSIVWDYVAVFEPGKLWDQTPPQPLYSHVPVIKGIGDTRGILNRLAAVSQGSNVPITPGDRQ